VLATSSKRCLRAKLRNLTAGTDETKKAAVYQRPFSFGGIAAGFGLQSRNQSLGVPVTFLADAATTISIFRSGFTMTKHVLLNNVTHKDLRVIRRYGTEFGDNVGTVVTVPTEYADIQREYPIFFRKDPASGEYQSIALLGFQKDENLFLENGRWNASYVPGLIARGPFLIGFQEQQVDGDVRKEAVIHIDLDNPHVSTTEGEPIFLPQGGNSRYLDHMASVLSGLRDGMSISKAMFAAFGEFELIEPIKVEIKLSENEKYDVLGLHTINHEKLANLSGEALEKLNRTGFLQGAFLVIASHSNMKKLIDMKYRRRVREAESAAQKS